MPNNEVTIKHISEFSLEKQEEWQRIQPYVKDKDTATLATQHRTGETLSKFRKDAPRRRLVK